MFDPFDMFDMFDGGGRRRFNPASVFLPGDVGWVYDTQNLVSMFQDVAGTIPANLPGHPVAKRLDLSGRGNHATQSVAASRPTLARRPASGVRNLLTHTEQFDNAVWGKVNSSIAPNAATAPTGEATADRITFSAQFGSLLYSIAFVAGQTYTFSMWVWVASGTRTYSVRENNLGTELGTITATTTPTRHSVTFVASATGPNALVALQDRSASGFVDTYIWRAQLELGATATADQRVGSVYDVTEAGQPDRWCLVTDGVDDGMITPTITPAAGADKVQVVAGVRKLSDAAQGQIFELSASAVANAGAFDFIAAATPATYSFRSRGTVASIATSPASFAAPINNVVTGLADIAGDSAILRVNGAQVAASATDQGTGQFGTYPAYLYRRGGTSLPAKIEDYGMICRISTMNLTAAQISQLEAWMNQRTGAY